MNGTIFEKVGVNISTVMGTFSEEMKRTRRVGAFGGQGTTQIDLADVVCKFSPSVEISHFFDFEFSAHCTLEVLLFSMKVLRPHCQLPFFLELTRKRFQFLLLKFFFKERTVL